jgi:Fe-S-cluster containining protein
MSKITKDDCMKCGACCAYYFDEDLWDVGRKGRGLFISNDDVSQIPVTIRRRLVVEEPLIPEMPEYSDRWLRGRKVGDHYQCKALEGELGNCKCSIYEQRPETCRTLEPGSEGCLKARAAFGFSIPSNENEG